MTIVPMYRRCPMCKRMYSWNPDVGRFVCPYCCFGGTKIIGRKLIEGIKQALRKQKPFRSEEPSGRDGE